MINNCLKCGRCCNSILLGYSPNQLKKFYLDWRLQRKNKEGKIIHLEDIWLLYPMLRFIGFKTKRGSYLYRCIHLTKFNRRYICDIHFIKPKMCKDYPYKTKGMRRVNLDIIECGFNQERRKK